MKAKMYSSKNWLISDLVNIRSLVVCLWLFMFSTLYTQAQIPELWGMTSEGGAYNNGVIFKTNLNGTNQRVVYSFNNEGLDPRSSLVQANNGMLYGTTLQGGAFNKGVLFEFNPITEVYTKKVDFNGTNGFGGNGLILSSNGKLYGISGGGAHGLGVIYQYDVTNSTLTVKKNFDASIGEYPIGKLLDANNGKFYGMTTNGGTHDEGVLFEYDPVTNTILKRAEFNGTNGGMPAGGLMQASNGKLYGTTFYGGVYYDGVLFEYDILSNTLTKLFDFGGNAGYWLDCILIEAANGKLYGGTEYGGLHGSGTLFEYDPLLDSVTIIFHLNNNTSGETFTGTFVEASNGKLYGMTFTGGLNNKGVLFELNPADNSVQQRVHFNGSNGAYPRLPGLIEIQLPCSTTIDSVSAEACFSYTSPSGKYTWTASGTYTDSTTSIWGCDSILIIDLTIRDSSECCLSPYIDSVSVQRVTCDSTEAGTSVQTFVGSDACDSVVTTISIYDPGSLVQLSPVTICEGQSAMIFGTAVSTAGTYYDTLSNVNGCDSILQQSLIVNPAYADTLQQHICQGDSIFLGGGYRSVSGLYADSLQTNLGCDSIVYTHLFVIPQILTSATHTICEGDSLEINGAFETMAGSYSAQFTSAAGCDSIHTGILIVHPIYSITIRDSICPGDSIYAGGAFRTTAGTYTDILIGTTGCDSIVNTILSLRTDSGCVQKCLTVVSDNSWMKSSEVSPTNLSGFWPGAMGLPGAVTFNIPVTIGQPYAYPSINPIEDAMVISTTNSVTYFRTEFSLSNALNLKVRLLITADDQADIYLNRHRVALISSFGRANYKYPAHDLKYQSDGTVINGFMGGDFFDVTSTADMDTLLKDGVNEIIVAVRNLGKTEDLGGFSFRMDINCADEIITQKSSEAHTQISQGLFAFPNPVSEVLTIQSELAISSLKLFDLTGKVVHSAGFELEKLVEVNTAGLPQGVYLLRVEEVGGQISTFKIIKD